jgi:pimeloyl-ACP methyl ester carboxylesterase
MPNDVQIHGSTGPLVLLIPGGAEAAEGFFPGLVEGLTADGTARVVVWDRPGAGASHESGTLADAPDHLNALAAELGEPLVVVGQSLGGAVALLFAAAHPQAVAGLVLVDATPINDAATCAQVERMARVLGRLSKVPGLGGMLRAFVRRDLERSMRAVTLRPDCRAALDRIGEIDIAALGEAVEGLGALAAGFRPEALPAVPAVVITAERPVDAPIAQAHRRIADALGVQPTRWPGAAHNAQLSHPDETLAVVRDVAQAVAAAR